MKAKELLFIWPSLFAFVFLEYLNIYICFIFFIYILIVQQWLLKIGKFSCRYILGYPQMQNFLMKDKTVVAGFYVRVCVNFFL